jgi:hypothetical protein
MREITKSEFDSNPEFLECSAISFLGAVTGTLPQTIVYVRDKMFLFDNSELNGPEYMEKMREQHEESKEFCAAYDSMPME